ncbi:aminotransferase class V-fold PLP-dependent enzyme [Amycolatopsis sp. NPDC098790]|uniref:aminotransferase class V-fold PLP-dependent enzyme n=1 Tax=Amycolatopsis sp. NPDC098790 TaxID=3363939 RepID=UPI003828C129
MPDGVATAVARHFPEKPAVAYLDTASIGLVPDAVRESVADCYRALGAGTRGMARIREVVARTRILLGAEFGCAPEDLTFLSSTGEAFNAVARAIDWHDGDEVVVLDNEFPTTLLPWTRLPGVRVVAASARDRADRLGALLDAIGTRTRVVAVSHVCSFTGVPVDLGVLGDACQQVGAMLVCDGAQAAGVFPVDTTAADFYVATGYKWMLAGFGIATLVSKPAARAALRPTLLGHGNEPPSTDLSYGTSNLAGIHALGAAAEVRAGIGLETLAGPVRRAVRRVHEGVTALGVKPVTDAEAPGAIISLPGLPDAAGVVERLGRAGIVVALRGGNVRVSPNFYTTDSEIDALLAALAGLV